MLSAAGFALVVGPFLVLMALASMVPTADFDAVEYHLAGPKGYFLAGKVRFLPLIMFIPACRSASRCSISSAWR